MRLFSEIFNKMRRFSSGEILMWVLVILGLISLLFELRMPSSDGLIAAAVLFIGKSSAVVAASTAAVALILSTRSSWHDKLFNGVTNIYRIRQGFVHVLLCSSLVHVVAAAAYPYITQTVNPQQVLSDQASAMAIGMIALVLAIGTYTARRVMHASFEVRESLFSVFSVVAIAGMLHFLLLDSPTSNDLGMTYSVLVAESVFGIFVFAYGLGRKYFSPSFHKYEVVEANLRQENITEIVMKPSAKSMHYEPGQYGWFRFDSPSMPSEAHPFTFASANNGPYVRIAVRSLGDFTKQLITDVSRGTSVKIEGPYGGFDYKQSTMPYQVWIGGDIGITPFLSMARSMDSSFKKQVSLVYIVGSPTEAIYYSELSEIEQITGGRLKVTPVIESISGFINERYLPLLSPDLLATDFYICGPAAMNFAIKDLLSSAGVQFAQIQTIDFKL